MTDNFKQIRLFGLAEEKEELKDNNYTAKINIPQYQDRKSVV